MSVLRWKEGIRVRAWSGDGTVELGDGTLVGYVTVYFWRMPDGSLRSQHNAEEVPPPELVERMTLKGGVLIPYPGNPRIELDSGDVVYGCQVWWTPLGRKQIEIKAKKE